MNCSVFNNCTTTYLHSHTTGRTVLDSRPEDGGSTIHIIEATLLVVIFLGCIIGNGMMCVVVFKHREARSRTYTLLGNLAIADLGLGLFCMPFTIITLISGDWVLGPLLCYMNGFMNAFWIPATVFSTTCIGMHKYYSIHDPFNPKRTWRRIRLFMIVTWTLSLLCAIGPLLGWNGYTYFQGSTQCGLAIPSTKLDYIYMIFLAVVVYSIPMLINIVSFVMVFKTVRKHTRRLRLTAVLSSTRTSAQKRTAVTFLVVFISYVISWTPFFVYGLLTGARIEEGVAGQYLTAAYIMGFSNTVHNPIIFAFRNENFRESFKEIILACCGRYRRKFRTITNTTLSSNFSFQLFARRESEFGSTWYLESEACGEGVQERETGLDNVVANSYINDDERVMLNAMKRHTESFIC